MREFFVALLPLVGGASAFTASGDSASDVVGARELQALAWNGGPHA